MKTEIDKLLKSIHRIDGYLTDNEAYFLYKMAKRCTGKGVIVEIGSYKGKSTVCLGEGSKSGNNIEVYSIDPHTGTSKWKKEYKKKIWSFVIFHHLCTTFS